MVGRPIGDLISEYIGYIAYSYRRLLGNLKWRALQKEGGGKFKKVL